VDGTGSGSCTMVGFHISSVENLCFATRVIVQSLPFLLDFFGGMFWRKITMLNG
jgi:hypothetical protein